VAGGPNFFAWFAIALALPVSIVLVRFWRPAVAVPAILFAGAMFLPPAIELDAPLIPPFGKETLVPMGVLIGCYLFRKRIFAGSRPFRGYDLFIVLRLVGRVGTWLTNTDAIKIGDYVYPALTFYDFFTLVFKEFIYWWPAFFLGRTAIRTPRDLRALFTVVAGAGVIYSFPIIYEILMSPQLNNIFYGFFPSDFMMTKRGGGFRPMVFMRHGLNLAAFSSFTVMAAAALGAAKGRLWGMRGNVIATYLFIVLALSHSLGALLYAALAIPLIWFTKPRTQARVAAVLGLLAFSYPVARAVDLLPVEKINAFTLDKFGEDRAGSLAYRLREEAFLMDRAMERIVFGWGGYARSFHHDPVTGKSLSTTDGLWAIEIGEGGAFAFVALFGLILWPAWRTRALLKKIEPKDRPLVSSLALMAAIYAVDFIPNSSVDPYLTFLVGVLAGIDTRGGLEPDYDPAAVPQGYAQHYDPRYA
jgi:hypothetical protein